MAQKEGEQMAPAKKKEQRGDNLHADREGAEKKKPEDPEKYKDSMNEAIEKKPGGTDGHFPDLEGQTPEQLIQESPVHQIELEMQAEELRRVQRELEKSHCKYIDLYEFALVGYLSLDDKTIIIKANLTAAALLGVERNNLINHGFGLFIDQECLELWDQYFLGLCRGTEKQVINLTIRRGDGSTFPARLEGRRFSPDGSPVIIHVVISDISDIVKLQEELREREAMVRALMNSPVDSIALVNRDGVIIDVNETLARKHNLAAEKMRGRNVYDLIQPDLSVSRRSRIEEVIRTGTEDRFVDMRAGYWFDNAVFPIRDAAGNITRVAIVARDITDQKRIEEALHTSHLRLESAMEAGNIAWWEMDCSTGEVLFSSRKAEMLGYPPGKFSHYSDFTTLLHPDDYEPTMQAMRDHLAGIKRKYETEYRIRTNTGEYRWFHDIGGVTESDLSGSPLRVTGLVIDITERRLAEEALRESEERFRLLLQHVPSVAVQGYSIDGTTQYWNDASEKLYGYTSGEAIGKNLVNLIIPPEMREDVRQACLVMAETGQPIPASELTLMKKDGSRVAVFSSHAIIKNSQGEMELFCIDIDLSERKLAEEKLRFSNALLSTQFETSIDGILVVDMSGKIISCNRRFMEVCGIPEEVIASGIDEEALQASLVNLAEPEEFLSKVRYLYLHRDEKSRDEILLKDGRILDRYTAPMIGSAGEYYGRIWHFRDITDERQVQNALKDAVDWLKIMQKEVKAGFWDWDMPTGKLTWSEEFLELFGLSPNAEPSFDTWLAVLHPDDRTPALEKIDQAVKERTDLWNEYRIILPDGQQRWIGASGITTYDGTGQALRMSGICLDITEKKRLDSALVESEQRYRGLIDGVPDFILVHRNGKILFVNPAAMKVIGDESEYLVGSDIMNYIAPESRPLVVAMMVKQAANEKIPPYEITIIPRSGVKRVTEVHGALIMYQGEPASLNVLSDITERKKAEERLRESEEKYRALLFGAGIGVGYWSPDGTLLFLNEISLKRLRANEGDYIGKNMREIFGGAAEKYLERLKKAVTSSDPLEYEDYVNLPSGEGWYLSVYSRISGLDGSVKGVQVLSMDVTDRKQAEEMRERLLIDLQQKNAELERFTYTVSHDLKSPLITIKGFLGYLEKDARSGDTGRLHEDIVRIHAATSKMEEFIASLLELSRVGRIVNPPASIPLSSLVQDAVETLDAQVRNRGVTIRVPVDLPEVYGDRVRLQQVMTNLIENGIKFMGDQKEPIIEISASTRDTMKTICVKDNGIGIAPENLDTVFSVFKRLNPAIEGTGIGLALVRRIIEVHGGKCWVESAGLGGAAHSASACRISHWPPIQKPVKSNEPMLRLPDNCIN